VEGAAPVTKYSFGFVNKNARIRDIMSYANACSTLGYSCARVPMFSTPRLQYSGAKIGVPAGKPGAADAARLLNGNRRTVARFR
jgi:hypothetical protein